MKIIFVGIHNKPGMEPLDSRTKSGKLIDRIILKLMNNYYFRDVEFIKTNLFDADYLPKEQMIISKMKDDWYKKYLFNFCKDSIVVLLGSVVKNEFLNYDFINRVNLKHPSSIWGKKKMNDYVLQSAKNIIFTNEPLPYMTMNINFYLDNTVNHNLNNGEKTKRITIEDFVLKMKKNTEKLPSTKKGIRKVLIKIARQMMLEENKDCDFKSIYNDALNK